MPSRQLTPVEGLIAGGISGAIAKTTIAPVDRVKILFQVNKDRQFSLRSAFRTTAAIVEKEGFLHLWRGNGANMVRVIPYAAVAFMTYDHYERTLIRTNVCPQGPVSRFLSGAAAGGTATLMTYPLDMLRARLAAQWSVGSHAGYMSVTRQILATEGFMGLVCGLTPTLMGVIPYAGLTFTTFHSLKAQLKKQMNLKHDSEIPTPLRLMAGGAAGLVAQTVTYPLDVIRRRMQVHGTEAYPSVFKAFMNIYRNEGIVGGLFKGISMNWVKGPVSVAVSFAINDFIKSKFRSRDPLFSKGLSF